MDKNMSTAATVNNTKEKSPTKLIGLGALAGAAVTWAIMGRKLKNTKTSAEEAIKELKKEHLDSYNKQVSEYNRLCEEFLAHSDETARLMAENKRLKEELEETKDKIQKMKKEAEKLPNEV